MTLKQFNTILKKTGLPVAYDWFDIDDGPPSLPYIAYIETARTPIYADNEIYAEAKQIDIELYTEKKSPEHEKLLEDILTENEIFYTFNEVGLIESENIYEVIYTIEII